MAEPSEFPSNDPLKNVVKPATPLLLPPPQINSPSLHIANNSPDTNDTTTTNEKINAQNSSSDEEPKNASTSNHHRHIPNTLYTQSSLQPHMGPIAKTPLLNPMALSMNSLSMNSLSANSADESDHRLHKSKYTHVNTINPYGSRRNINNDNNILPMQSKSSVTLDECRRIKTSLSVHDEDQKIIENIHINRDDSIEKEIYNQHINNVPIAKGIPTTPSYPTPPIHSMNHNNNHNNNNHNNNNNNNNINNVMRMVHNNNHPDANSSQFMEQQQHRKRTNKLKFTRSKWSDHGKRVLLNTTVRLDRVCHTLVQTRQRFGVCPVEMRQLSLIIAVIERAMYGYGRQVQENKERLKQYTHTNTMRTTRIRSTHITPNVPNVGLNASMSASISAPNTYYNTCIDYNNNSEEDVNSEDSVETIGKCTNPSIVTGHTYVRTTSPINTNKLVRHQQYILNNNKSKPKVKSKQNQQLTWRHPGGVVSLLEILGRVLRSTEEELIIIGNIANLTDFVSNNKLIWLISILGGIYIFAVPFSGPIKFILEQCSKFTSLLTNKKLSFLNNITSVFPEWMRKLLNKWIKFLININTNILLNKWMNRFRFIILPTLIYIIHKCILKIYLMRLSKLQNKLNSIILHWQLCMTAITPKNRLDQSLSDRIRGIQKYKYNSGEEEENNNNKNKIDIYQWILRLVPPSAHIDACFWYGANFRLRLLRKLMDVNYAVTCYYYRIFGSSTLFWPMAFPILFYYILNPHRAACRANEFLANPDIRIIRVFYSILDSKLARWITLKVFPKLGLMPQLKTAITFEIRVDDINLWTNIIDIDNNNININNSSPDINIKFKNIDTVRIKIFATKKLNIKPDYINSGDIDGAQFLNEPIATNLIGIDNRNNINNYPAHHIDNNDYHNNDNDLDLSLSETDDQTISPINPTLINKRISNSNMCVSQKQENGVIFYIHGGGFLGNFCASDLRILSQWSELVNAPIVEVDYSLMPSKWPQQLQECILAYKCLCYGRLGFNARRIAVIGDSNGGGLAVSMILNIIQCGLRVPDVLILTSPILSLRQTEPTTSKLLFNMDPLVPMNLIVQLTKYYLIPTICDVENDPLISPLIAAPDYLLSSFPPTTIVVGGLDPFLDDSIDFAHRLSNIDVNVDVKLKIYKFAPHAFLNFNYILPDVNHAIHLIAECIDQAFLS